MKQLLLFIAFVIGCATTHAQQSTPRLIDRILSGDTSLAPASNVLADDEDIHWDTRFGMPGVDRDVQSLTVDGDWVYVGGLFIHAGNIPAHYIARWNRKTHVWESLGEGNVEGLDGVALAMAVMGDSIIVGGQFTHAGDVDAANIAVWNKKTRKWGALGQGGTGDFSAYVSAIAVKGREIYVGGRFTAMGSIVATNVARWDGSRWRKLGAGVNLPVYAMKLYDDTLYAGGEFTTADEEDANHIAKWDGSAWSAMGDGFNNAVFALAMMDDTLYAGGAFSGSGVGVVGADDSMRLVARWDKQHGQWQGLEKQGGLEEQANRVYALAAHGDSLFVGGQFDGNRAPGGPAQLILQNLMVWAHGRWTALYAGSDAVPQTVAQLPMRNTLPPIASPTEVYALADDGEQVYIGGSFPYTRRKGAGDASYPFSSPAAQLAQHIVAWNTVKQQWINPGHCMNDDVLTLAMSSDGLYVGGDFTSASGMVLSKIARWKDGAWHPLGEGLRQSGSPTLGIVESITTGGGRIYAGGLFGWGNDSASHVAAWDGSAWTPYPIGKTVGSTPTTIDTVMGLAYFKGSLYKQQRTTLMRWTGSAWTSVDIPAPPDIRLFTITTDGNHLYIGGRSGVYQWDGVAPIWTTLGTTNDTVLSIAIDGDRVYAGGRFTKVNNIPVKRVAMFDGGSSTWSPLGTGMENFNQLDPPFVQALTVANGQLYAGGRFATAGGVVVNNIALWNGESWRGFGSGVDSAVNAIVVNGEEMYIGGGFRMVGGTIHSWRIAHWNEAASGVMHQERAGRGSKSTWQAMSVQATPNPASGECALRYTTTVGGHIRLSMYDVMGREILRLVDETMNAGSHVRTFDASELDAGLYYCRVESAGSVATGHVVIVR